MKTYKPKDGLVYPLSLYFIISLFLFFNVQIGFSQSISDSLLIVQLKEKADSLSDSSNHKEALKYYKEVHDKSEAYFGKEHENNAEIFFRMSLSYAKIGQDEESLSFADKSIEMANRLLGEINLISSKNYRALSYLLPSYGEYEKAIEYANKHIEITDSLKLSKVDRAKARANLGVVYTTIPELDSAIFYLEQAELVISDTTVEDAYQGFLNNNIGAVYYYQRNARKAKARFEIAELIIREKLGPNHIQLSNPLMNLGNCLSQEGKGETALRYYQEAQRILERESTEDAKSLLTIRTNIAALYSANGLVEKANKIYLDQLRIVEKKYGTDNDLAFRIYRNLGGNYSDLEDYNLSETYYSKSLASCKAVYPDGNYETARTLSHIALVKYQQEKYEESIQLAQDCLDILKKKNNLFSVYHYEAYEAMFFTYRALDQFELYENYLDSAYLSIGYDLKKPDEFDRIFETHVFLQVLESEISLLWADYWRKKDLKLLETILDRMELTNAVLNSKYDNMVEAGSLYEQIKLRKLIFEKGISASVELFEHTKDSSLINQSLIWINLNRSKKLYESLKQKEFLVYADLSSELISEKEEIEFSLQKLYTDRINLSNEEKLDSIDVLIFNLEREKALWKEQYEKQHPKYSFLSNSTKIELYKPKPNEALLDFYIGEEEFFSFIIYHDRIVYHKSNQVKSLSEEIDKINQAITEGHNEISVEPVQNIVFGDLKLQDNIQRLRIIPSGKLHSLPFEIFKRNNNYWVNDFQISYAPSQQLINLDFFGETKNNGVGLYSPSYGEKVDSSMMEEPAYAEIVRDGNLHLAGALSEANKITDLFKGELYQGSKATEHTFKNSAKSHGILHLAMHAFLDVADGLNSYLYFGSAMDSLEDNKLHAFELYNLDIPAELAVLSACNTGSGNEISGEGVLSLSNAFAFAGVKSTISSLWKVPDLATELVMVSFYKNLKEGQSKDEALQNAKLEYLKNDQISNKQKAPYYWAGFIISGDSNPIIKNRKYSKWILMLLLMTSMFVFIKYLRKAKGDN